MNSAELLTRRHRAERRFQFYGRLAITFALLSLAFLLVTICARGWQGFFYTEIRLAVAVPAEMRGLDKTALAQSDMRPVIKNALTARFPGVEGRLPKRQLSGLLSDAAPRALKRAILTRRTGNEPLTLWLPASDMADRMMKARGAEGDIPGVTALQQGWLTSLKAEHAVRVVWNPYFFRYGDSLEPEQAGFLGSMAGSFFTLVTCILVSFPIGVMAAIYLEEFARKGTITEWIEINISNLAAVPSIVFGLLGLQVFLTLFGVPRSAALAGGLTLALMILPTVIIATRASLRAIPDSIRDAARGLGASPLQVVLHHTLPLAIPGIMTGAILGVARAMGETAPLLMIGMVAFIADIPHGFLDAATTMPVQIYLWSTNPEPSFVAKTAAGIMVLLVMVIVMNSLAMYLRKRFERHW